MPLAAANAGGSEIFAGFRGFVSAADAFVCRDLWIGERRAGLNGCRLESCRSAVSWSAVWFPSTQRTIASN